MLQLPGSSCSPKEKQGLQLFQVQEVTALKVDLLLHLCIAGALALGKDSAHPTSVAQMRVDQTLTLPFLP